MNFSKTALAAAMLSAILLNTSCDKKKTTETSSTDSLHATAQAAPDTLVVEEDIWILDENKMNNIPLTSETPKTEKKTTAKKTTPKEKDAAVAKAETKTVSKKQIDSLLTGINYTAADTVQPETMAIPLEETQTVVAYNKKGVAKEAFQVVSASNGDVEHIIFTNKKHIDIYNVQAGMTGKEVKKLRKELKHMVKNGQVFLYDDQSNIMYLMGGKDKKAGDVADAEIDDMEVTAIIWKDKKHHTKK